MSDNMMSNNKVADDRASDDRAALNRSGGVPKWFFDEFTATGVDYQRPEIVKRYDTRHGHFRDFAAEAIRIRERTGMKPGDRIIDLGCGTGLLTAEYAPFCAEVDAADVSEPMLAGFQQRIDELGIRNIRLHHAGFLTYYHEGEPADGLISTIALHHLPDFWKVMALRRAATFLKPGGFFYLLDVVFHFMPERIEQGVETLLTAMETAAGHEAHTHIKNEFSTFDWLLEPMMERTGFTIRQRYRENEFLTAYVLRKNA